MIERAKATALAPIREELRGPRELIIAHGLALDAHNIWVEASKQCGSQSDDVTILKADILGLRRDVDELKFIDISILWDSVEIYEVPVHMCQLVLRSLRLL